MMDKKYSDSIKCYKKVLELDPNHNLGIKELAQCGKLREQEKEYNAKKFAKMFI